MYSYNDRAREGNSGAHFIRKAVLYKMGNNSNAEQNLVSMFTRKLFFFKVSMGK